jgi:hypothetical protein
MLTCIKASSAGNSFNAINFDPGIAIFIRFRRNTGTHTATFMNTLIATDTIIVGKYKRIIRFCHKKTSTYLPLYARRFT